MPSQTGRRQFLAVSAAGIGVLAGCTEGDDQPSESSDSSGPDDYSTSPGETVGGSGRDSSSGSSPDDEGERRQLLRTYNDGIGEANDGIEYRERGVGAWNDRNHSSCERHYERAENHFREAREIFQDALDRSYGLDYPDARGACEDSAEYCAIMINASQSGQLAASQAGRGNTDSANDHIDETRRLERSARRLNVLDTSTMERILDLD